jgi:uncharacterized protein YbjT (DUF2867 family)
VRLALFGGTGTVGSAVLGQALEHGHEVRALARTPEKLSRTDPALTVVPGDALDPAAVATTLAGCHSVVSALGGFGGPESISVGTATIVAQMRELGVRRLVVVQGMHLHFPGDPPGWGRAIVGAGLGLVSRPLTEASAVMAEQIQDSDVDWTVVRLCRVVTGPGAGACRTGLLAALGPWSTVPVGDAARVVLQVMCDPTTIRTAPMVAGGRPRRSDRPARPLPAPAGPRSSRKP